MCDDGRKEKVNDSIWWSRETRDKVVDADSSTSPKMEFHLFGYMASFPPRKAGAGSSTWEIPVQVARQREDWRQSGKQF